MALLAKYYLSYNGHMDTDYDPSRRKATYYADSCWRPSVVPQNHAPAHMSAPTSPVIRRLSLRNRSRKPSTDGSSSSRLHSAPSSPHVANPEPDRRLSRHVSDEEKSKTPPQRSQSIDHGEPKEIFALKKSDGAINRRARYSSLRRKPQNRTFSGTSNGCEPSPPNSGNDHPLLDDQLRGRSSSNPLSEGQRSKKDQNHIQPELMITLNYSRNSSFITATINKARNLTEKTAAFVRVHLYEGFKPISLKQTNIIISGPDVEFKQAFMFSLSKDSLGHTHLLFELFKSDDAGNECKYGDVVIGPRAGGSGCSQWRQACTHPNTPCSMWHTVI